MDASFENDLLISYAHLDDQALLEGQPGWVSNLHRILEVRVAQFLGEKPRIWRSPKLQGNDYFADVILDHLPKVAALLTVLSPRYVQSEWCNLELQEFCRASSASGGLRIDQMARLFKVVKTPVPLERHPEPLQPLIGYEFYVLDPDTGRPRELSQLHGAEAQRQFLARLDDLAYDISRLLERLRGDGALARPAEPRGTVYLAETSFDLREDREAVKRDLVRNGYEVLPDRPLPLVAGELVSFVEEQLARSRLSIHLIGAGYGVVPDGAARSIVALQHDVAERHSAAGDLPRLIWIPPGLETEDTRQRELLHHLRTAPAVHTRAELLEGSLEDLKSATHRTLAPPPEAAARPPQPAGSAPAGPLRIYVVCDPRDLEAVRPLEDHLFARGYEAVLPLFDEDEAQARQDHEESLCTCDAVLLYYGEAGEPWLRRKLREIQKSAGLGRETPLLARGIYVAAPPSEPKERLRTLEARILREPGPGFSSDTIEPFLAEIQSRKAGAAS